MGINVFPQTSSSPYTAGTTFGAQANRPASPTIGQSYYNGDLATFEIWNGSTWAIANSAPASVTAVTATDTGSGRAYNNGRTSVAFTPASVGGLATLYTVTSSPGAYAATGTSSPIIVTGLQSGVSYTYNVVASNAVGAAAGLISTAVTATTIPTSAGTPTAALVTDGTGNITVSWTAATSGGAGTTTSYVVTSSPGGITSASTTSTSTTMTGLTNGTAYTFTVVASNANGSAAASSASNSVTSLGGPVLSNYLVVAGGASAWGTAAGGGGGAVKTGASLSPGSSWTVTVGAAGTASNANTAGSKSDAQGKNSVLASITCQGGGTGGGGTTAGLYNGTAGGNGGGGYHYATSGTASGGGSTDNGNSGGSASGDNSYYSLSCGGGGAGGAGSGINSGAGVANSITGTSINYGPGGAGGVYTSSGSVQTNGAARGGSAPTANNGAGVGSFSGGSAPTTGSAGIVVFEYPTTYRAITTIPGTLTYTVSSAGGYYKYTFTAGTGTVTW